jgi:hypothetical protein
MTKMNKEIECNRASAWMSNKSLKRGVFNNKNTLRLIMQRNGNPTPTIIILVAGIAENVISN